MSNARFSRPKHRRDSNHSSIVGELRKLGFVVADISQSGAGVGDILVGWTLAPGVIFMYELKPAGVPSAQKLTAAEQRFHDAWPGHIAIATTTEEIIDDMKRHGRTLDYL